MADFKALWLLLFIENTINLVQILQGRSYKAFSVSGTDHKLWPGGPGV